ncbi:MAG: hypothetical protein FWF01_00940 [Alphaproteobacteria bacterium]|nr:hypothetical protein [Alphaproteobacteria bacterium]
MMRKTVFILAVAAALLPGARALGNDADVHLKRLFTAFNVRVDVTDESAAAARQAAMQEAYMKAFAEVYRRLTNTPVPVHAGMTHERIVPLISDVVIEHERTSRVRFIGAMNIAFRPAETLRLVESMSSGHISSPAMVLAVVPLFFDGEDQWLWQDGNPWLAFLQSNANESVVAPIMVPNPDRAARQLDVHLARERNASRLLAFARNNGGDGVLLTDVIYNDGHMRFLASKINDSGKTVPVADISVPGDGDQALRDGFTAIVAELERQHRDETVGRRARNVGILEALVHLKSPRELPAIEATLSRLRVINRFDLRAIKGNKVQFSLYFSAPADQVIDALVSQGLDVYQIADGIIRIESR